MIGIGVRMGQDIGVHRRQRTELLTDHESVKQDELRKRAFWFVLVVCILPIQVTEFTLGSWSLSTAY